MLRKSFERQALPWWPLAWWPANMQRLIRNNTKFTPLISLLFRNTLQSSFSSPHLRPSFLIPCRNQSSSLSPPAQPCGPILVDLPITFCSTLPLSLSLSTRYVLNNSSPKTRRRKRTSILFRSDSHRYLNIDSNEITWNKNSSSVCTWKIYVASFATIEEFHREYFIDDTPSSPSVSKRSRKA